MSSRQRPRYSYSTKRTSTSIIALQIENARLRKEIARLHVERAAVARFIADADPSGDRATRFGAIANAAQQALRSHGAALYLYSPNHEDTAEAFFTGYADPDAARQHALLQSPLQLDLEQPLLDGEQPFALTIRSDERTRPYPDPAETVWHTLTLPLRSAGRVIGCLQLSRGQSATPFDVSDAAFGRYLTAPTALLIERIQQEPPFSSGPSAPKRYARSVANSAPNLISSAFWRMRPSI